MPDISVGQEKPMSIDRQMLLANFAAAALTAYLSPGTTDATTAEVAHDCFEIAQAMLAEYEKRIK